MKNKVKSCSVVKVVDSCSVGNRDKIKSKVVKKGLTQDEADKLVEKMNELSKWAWPLTTFYIFSKNKAA
jgi:hypothetical protein